MGTGILTPLQESALAVWIDTLLGLKGVVGIVTGYAIKIVISFLDNTLVDKLSVAIKTQLSEIIKAIIDADLDEDEIFVFNKTDHAGFFTDFVKHYTKKEYNLKLSSSETPSISKYSKSITLIGESGLYALILNSRKPHAKAFKKWVTKKVLPTLRSGIEPDLVFNYAADAILKHTNVLHQKKKHKTILLITWLKLVNKSLMKSLMQVQHLLQIYRNKLIQLILNYPTQKSLCKYQQLE
jgi:prophage antirepressor-like protein